MPQPYKLAQAEMRRQLLNQWSHGPLEGPISLELAVKGEGRGDSDNIAGAFMDAAHGILWVDDRVTIIPELKITWKKASRDESLWIVYITNLEQTPVTME